MLSKSVSAWKDLMLRPIETHYFKLKVSKYKKTVEKKSE